MNVCNTTLVGLRGLEITELEVLRNHDLTTMDIRYFFGQKTSLPLLFDQFMRQVNVASITKNEKFLLFPRLVATLHKVHGNAQFVL